MTASLSKYANSLCFITLISALSIAAANAKTVQFESRAEQQLFKLDGNGIRLSMSAVEWACVEDFSTGLMWQKRDPSNAEHNHASYTWFQPHQRDTGSQLAYPISSPLNVTCNGYRHDDPSSYCNTDAYIKRINQLNYCGFSDWRLPSTNELKHLAKPNAAITPHMPSLDLEFFPFYDRFVYWTRSINNAGKVLTIAQEKHVLANAETSDQLSVRLVRGTQY